MPEIKFRGINVINKKWVYGDLVQYESGERAIFSDKLSQYGYEATEISRRDKKFLSMELLEGWVLLRSNLPGILGRKLPGCAALRI
jgi:hypothetical protein